MSNYVIVTESGADIPPELAKRYKIEMIPMHISFGGETKDDMTFPVEDAFEYYEKTGLLPQTSGATPFDFETVFDEIHRQYPQKHILHLAYSAATTCSYQSALIAADGRDYITSIDTKSVSAGQAMIVLSMAEYLGENPKASLEDVKEKADRLISHIRMGFFPGDLAYLKAGGRVGNAAFLGATILSIKPLIEIENGKLVSTKKYRGSIASVAAKLIRDYSKKYQLRKEKLALVYSGRLDDTLKEIASKAAYDCGFRGILWVRAGCVVSTHSGPGGFGIVGLAKC